MSLRTVWVEVTEELASHLNRHGSPGVKVGDHIEGQVVGESDDGVSVRPLVDFVQPVTVPADKALESPPVAGAPAGDGSVDAGAGVAEPGVAESAPEPPADSPPAEVESPVEPVPDATVAAEEPAAAEVTAPEGQAG